MRYLRHDHDPNSLHHFLVIIESLLKSPRHVPACAGIFSPALAPPSPNRYGQQRPFHA